MSDPVVTVAFGKANFPRTSVQMMCFRVQAPFIRDSGATSGRRVSGSYREYPLSNLALHGSIHRSDVEHQAGVILLMQSSWKRDGAPIRDGAVFLRLREGATKWRISAKLPLEPVNTYGAQAVVFEGFADILDPADTSAYGLEVPRHWREKFMSLEEVEECFILEQLLPERIPRPNLLMVNEGGKKKLVEVAAAPPRRLVMRRK